MGTALGCSKFILFSTIGRQAEEFVLDSGGITYEQYFTAVKEWADANTNVTYVDCRKFLKNLVASGILKKEDLYLNVSHTSPMANELMFNMLKKVIDYKI